MDESTEKRIIAFTSQSLRQYGIRAVRMDDIARNMNISKRTIYQIYTTELRIHSISSGMILLTYWNIFGRFLKHISRIYIRLHVSFGLMFPGIWNINTSIVYTIVYGRTS